MFYLGAASLVYCILFCIRHHFILSTESLDWVREFFLILLFLANMHLYLTIPKENANMKQELSKICPNGKCEIVGLKYRYLSLVVIILVLSPALIHLYQEYQIQKNQEPEPFLLYFITIENHMLPESSFNLSHQAYLIAKDCFTHMNLIQRLLAENTLIDKNNGSNIYLLSKINGTVVYSFNKITMLYNNTMQLRINNNVGHGLRDNDPEVERYIDELKILNKNLSDLQEKIENKDINLVYIFQKLQDASRCLDVISISLIRATNFPSWYIAFSAIYDSLIYLILYLVMFVFALNVSNTLHIIYYSFKGLNNIRNLDLLVKEDRNSLKNIKKFIENTIFNYYVIIILTMGVFAPTLFNYIDHPKSSLLVTYSIEPIIISAAVTIIMIFCELILTKISDNVKDISNNYDEIVGQCVSHCFANANFLNNKIQLNPNAICLIETNELIKRSQAIIHIKDALEYIQKDFKDRKQVTFEIFVPIIYLAMNLLKIISIK